MKNEAPGLGCLGVLALGFAVVAVLSLIAGLSQSQNASGAFLPFVGSSLAAVLCWNVAQLRKRVRRIERELGLPRALEEHDTNETDGDSNMEVHRTR